MKSKDIFNLAIRLLGLVVLYDTLRAIPAAALAFKAVFPTFHFYNLGYYHYDEAFAALWIVGWPLLLTVWLLRGAFPIMRIAYPDSPAHKPTAGAAEEGDRTIHEAA